MDTANLAAAVVKRLNERAADQLSGAADLDLSPELFGVVHAERVSGDRVLLSVVGASAAIRRGAVVPVLDMVSVMAVGAGFTVVLSDDLGGLVLRFAPCRLGV